jgi:hypothetical protein
MTDLSDRIQRLCEAVYRKRLADDAGGHDQKWKNEAADRMIAKDGDGGIKFSKRALLYSAIIRATLEAIEEEALA